MSADLRCQVSFLTKPPATAKRKKTLPSQARADAQ